MLNPIRDDAGPIDVTDAIIRAVADQLWNHHGGNATLNWLEAEAFVQTNLVHSDPPSATLRFTLNDAATRLPFAQQSRLAA